MRFIVLAFLALFAVSAHAEVNPAYSDAISTHDHDITVTQAAYDHIAGDGLAAIMMQAASAPVFDRDGEQVGYMLTEIESGSVYETIGLQDGDIVLELDGVPLTNPKVAVETLKRVKSSDDWTALINRGRQLIRFRVRVI